MRWDEAPIPHRRGERTVLGGRIAFGAAVHCVGQAIRLNDPWLARGVAYRWDGLRWTETATPEIARYWGLYAVDGATPDDLWAVGADAEQPVILHGDGRAWTRVPIPATGCWGQLTDVVALGTYDVWATGGLASQPGSHALRRGAPALAMHWNGRRWSLTRPPSDTIPTRALHQ
jgi:hypothetical protein